MSEENRNSRGSDTSARHKPQETGKNRAMAQRSAAPDQDNNLGRGAPQDREDRIRQRQRELQQEKRDLKK